MIQQYDNEVNQQTGTRELTTDLRLEVNQQTDTRELTADFRSEVN
jgi:DNA-dependent RNA polymerase auxiliary subunit epsilon